jgi:pimeloyl-ACP methyl ester carboxylesterase
MYLANGLRLHCVRSGDQGGNPVLFLHGWPDSWFSFSRVLSSLSSTLNTVVFDQRGFGESDKPESGYAIGDFAADAIALLDVLGIQRATLVGHSFGSFVARRAALSHSDRVNGLVLIGTGFSTSNPVTRDLQNALRDLPDPIPESFAREFQQSTIYHPVPPEFFDRIVVESLKLLPRLWPTMIDSPLEYDDTGQLAGVRARTLLLWGDHDALFSRDDQDRFLTMLPSARLKVYAETGHCPNWERPVDVAAEISRFVAADD